MGEFRVWFLYVVAVRKIMVCWHFIWPAASPSALPSPATACVQQGLGQQGGQTVSLQPWQCQLPAAATTVTTATRLGPGAWAPQPVCPTHCHRCWMGRWDGVHSRSCMGSWGQDLGLRQCHSLLPAHTCNRCWFCGLGHVRGRLQLYHALGLRWDPRSWPHPSCSVPSLQGSWVGLPGDPGVGPGLPGRTRIGQPQGSATWRALVSGEGRKKACWPGLQELTKIHQPK